ncbi:MAG: hypothetical protein JWS12_240 [Candidatus Saccharibacteria bacterium]|nr:hypothetical protein [Candidatus Saccharibacteria bacterium]
MLNKIKTILQTARVSQLKDIRVFSQAVFAILVLMVSWSGVKVIQSNYELQRQISALEQQNSVQKLENDNVRLKNQYYNTDQYLELSARRQFGKAAPGETEILVPKTVAYSHTVDTASKAKVLAAASPESAHEKNFRAWMNFFLHRQSSTP